MKLALVLLLAVVTCLGDEARKVRCGTDTDCVTVKDVKGQGQLLVDHLNLSDKDNGDTIAVVEKRLPSWFGPPRPVVFEFKGVLLDPEIPLAAYGIKLAEEILMYRKSAVEEEL